MAIFFTGLMLLFWSAMGFQLWRLNQPERQLRRVDSTARQLDLALDQLIGPSVQARLIRRERVAIIGTTLLLTTYLPIALWADQHRTGAPSPAPLLFVLPFLVVMGSRPLLLSALMVFDTLRRERQPGPRTPRTVAPTITDYVRPIEVWAARLLAVVSVPACAIAAGLDPSAGARGSQLSTGMLVATALSGPVLLALCELCARMLLALPQPAATPVELAWDDAFRSLQLRELYTLVTGASLMISVFTLAALETSMIGLYGIVLTLLLLGFAGEPASHFRRRLWPSPGPAGPPMSARLSSRP